MKLNAAEKAVMNNPVRAAMQRGYEATLLTRLGGRVDSAGVLEVGCGRGVGIEIILDRFGAASVDGFDFDPDMVDSARKRLGRRGDRVRLWVGDAAAIAAPEATYDAVFDFGIIHHVPDWRGAVAEVARVLRPGGRFFFEEVTRHALSRRFYRTLFEHPDADRFSASEFVAAIEDSGIRVGDRWTERFFGDFVFGAGIRSSSS